MPNPYKLILNKTGYVIIVVNRQPEQVPIIGTTRARLHDDIRYRLVSKDAYWGAEELHNRLDDLIWNHVPKRERH